MTSLTPEQHDDGLSFSQKQLEVIIRRALDSKRNRWNYPTDEGVALLLFKCWLVKSAYHSASASQPVRDATDRARIYLQGFVTELNLLIDLGAGISREYTRPAINNHPMSDTLKHLASVADKYTLRYEKIRNLAARWLELDLFPAHGAGENSKHWNIYASFLGEAFSEAVATSNTRRLGYSEDGPLARFVYLVLPVLTGQNPKSVNNVAVQLRKVEKFDPWVERLGEAVESGFRGRRGRAAYP